MGAFKEPHGGHLRELYLGESTAEKEKELTQDLRSWDLTARQICDLELLLNGAFSPLEGFLCRSDYESVLTDMRLESGVLWPIPVTLDVTSEFIQGLEQGERIALRDPEGVLLALMTVEDVWTPDKLAEANAVFGTESPRHPGVNYLLNAAHEVYLGGRLQGVEPPVHYDFKLLRDSPAELRGRFRKLGWRRVVAYHASGPMHRAEHELTLRAAAEQQANLLIQPDVGMSRSGSANHYTHVRCYEHILCEYPEQTTTLSILNLATRMAGPREAIWHAIVRKNYGCTHFIVEREHADPGAESGGSPFYGPDDAQILYREHEKELDITMVAFEQMVFVEERAQHMPMNETTPEMKTMTLTGAEFRRRLHEGLDIPDWFSYPAVIDELRKLYPPRNAQGFTVFFTGLSGSGKSTIANALMVKLLESGGRRVTLLDGDVVRKHLSSELGFSKEHRDLNILRIGYVASEVTKHGGIAICAPIAPYTRTRAEVRAMVEAGGGFVEVHVATSIEVCESRDRKGLYARARAGLIKGFTGIDDPYEEPVNPEIRIETERLTPELAAHQILVKLESLGYIR